MTGPSVTLATPPPAPPPEPRVVLNISLMEAAVLTFLLGRTAGDVGRELYNALLYVDQIRTRVPIWSKEIKRSQSGVWILDAEDFGGGK